MPIRQYRPTSPGRRGMSVSTFEEITKTKPEKSLTVKLNKHAGRNNQGKITVRHRGGGAKRAYRIIDFKRAKDGVPATVAAIEYDPNRSARIALLHYLDGEKRYILAPIGVAVGDRVEAGPRADIKPGNSLPLANIPLGTMIHNVELREGRGGQLGRSAGSCSDGRRADDGSIGQEGPVHRFASHEEGERDARVGREAGGEDLVAPLDDHARHGRLHVRGAQRPEVHPRLHHRERCRSQA